jgi:hypothetical protein
MQCANGFDNPQPSTDSPMRIVFMGLGIAEINKQPVTQELSNMPVIAPNHLSTGGLIRTDHVPVLFGVELSRQGSGIDQVAEHDRELPSFRVGRRRCSRTGCNQQGGLFLDGKRWRWLSRGSADFLGIADPDQNSVILVSGKPFRLNQVDLQICDVVVIQVKSALQGAIGDALLPLKQLNDLGNKLIIVHDSIILAQVHRLSVLTTFSGRRVPLWLVGLPGKVPNACLIGVWEAQAPRDGE